ncbi:short chain dehydrogenase [compost metagenome]
MPEQRLKGKIAVVTGGGSGIGKAAAIRFAEHGATEEIARQARTVNDDFPLTRPRFLSEQRDKVRRCSHDKSR